jgi:hypothetical protein
MPSINAGALDRCFRSKLKAEVLDERRDRCYEVYDNAGFLVARTWLSHGWRGNEGIDVSMLAKIRRQLKLRTLPELVALVSCPLGREEYLEIASLG